MSGPLLRFRNAAALAAAIAATACAGGRQGAPAPIPPAPVVATPVPTPREVSIPVPEATAPSGTLLAIGVKSDAKEFVFGTSGAPWILAAGGRADRLRAPLSFAAEGGAASRRWAAQAGAYSQEETARGIADRLARDQGVPASVVFSAERGLYRVLVGDFATREEAAALVERLKAAGEDALVAEGTAATAPATLLVTDETGTVRRVASPADLYPGAPGLKIALDATSYRGSLRVLANARGTINVINRVDLEEYLYGVVPAEMGPKRFDELEALKAQAVAARTYAMAHRGQFASEGYDLCATPKCQVYGGLGVEDPLTTAAVDGTRGLVLASAGKFADALFVSTCGGKTENVENVFGEEPVPYLVAVECGELATTAIEGARLPKGERLRGRSPLEWRGAVLRLRSPRSRAPRGAALATAQDWAGVPRRGVPPAAALDAAAVYPSLVDAFGLASAEHEHLSPAGISYAAETPALSDALSGEARDAFDFWVRFRLGAGEALPPPDRRLSEEEYAGLLFSAALRLGGIVEASGRFLSREGSNLWIKTTDGRVGLPDDPEVPLARHSGDVFWAASGLTLRGGDRVHWWKRGARVLAFWVDADVPGPTFERESAWTEWVRRVNAKELARRMNGRVAGAEVVDLTVTKRSASGRAIELRVRTDAAEATLKRFDLRQALGLPEMLFTVQRARGASGETEFVFLGRGWGHGVGLCQNGAFGMALGGRRYDEILKHYYTGIDIVPAGSVVQGTPSTR